jgi:hypothetical protein
VNITLRMITGCDAPGNGSVTTLTRRGGGWSNACSTGYTGAVHIVQRLRPGALDHELAKVEAPRDPPVPVTVWLSLDGCAWNGELFGWAANPNGANDGWRGLVLAPREFAPGFWAEYLGWARAEYISPR